MTCEPMRLKKDDLFHYVMEPELNIRLKHVEDLTDEKMKRMTAQMETMMANHTAQVVDKVGVMMDDLKKLFERRHGNG